MNKMFCNAANEWIISGSGSSSLREPIFIIGTVMLPGCPDYSRKLVGQRNRRFVVTAAILALERPGSKAIGLLAASLCSASML